MSAAPSLTPDPAFEEYLAREQEKGLLRFLTCGSVDDGKSTLIGRLLYDSRNVFEDQIHAVAKATRNHSAGGLDLSLLTDGLRAEREQGITIDVAYRYFATSRRKFIIADTPGHEQYTRNMATGASTADLAIILIDARYGVLSQSRRHAFICSLLGIPRFVVAINKMDLAGYQQAVFERIRAEFCDFLTGLGVPDAYFLPISALTGDQVVTRSIQMPWFLGPSLLEYLETVDIAGQRVQTGFRFPVQRVSRPDQFFRGYAGQIASGAIRPGDTVTVLPSGLRSRVKRISTFDGDLLEAHAPMAITLELDRQLDISRGDLLYSGSDDPHVDRRFEARVVWMDARPFEPRRRYLLKHATQITSAEITVRHRVNIDTLAEEPAESLEMNAIAAVEIVTAKPLFFDAYHRNRITGSFILIDPETNATSASGMIRQPVTGESRTGSVAAEERIARWGHRGGLVRVVSEQLARSLERALFERGCAVAAVASEAQGAVFEQAGMLAVLVSPAGWDGQLHRLIGQLEANGVLMPTGIVSGGGGI